jgi:acetylglutamate kinase
MSHDRCDKAGNTSNIIADTAAAYIGARSKRELINMTDTKGVLQDATKPPDSLMCGYRIRTSMLQESGVVTAAIPKLECCAHAGKKARTGVYHRRTRTAAILSKCHGRRIGTMVTA